MIEQTDTLESAVGNFLAVLFRDGGHKTEEIGSLVGALIHAEGNVIDLFTEVDELRDEVSDRVGDIAKLRTVNENNLEGWQQNVAGLQRQIERLKSRIDHDRDEIRQLRLEADCR